MASYGNPQDQSHYYNQGQPNIPGQQYQEHSQGQQPLYQTYDPDAQFQYHQQGEQLGQQYQTQQDPRFSPFQPQHNNNDYHNLNNPKPHNDAYLETASLDSDRENVLRDNSNPHEFVTWAPEERFRLGYLDVISLVINRMIGTGIFNNPQRVIQGTGSTGTSILFWLAGVFYCLAGTHVYIEYGLNVPRYIISGLEQSVPRSGGDLNYLQYVFRQPAYRPNTFLLATCIFGFGFIAFGNMAGNSVSFATRVLRAADIADPDNGAVRGIAIGVALATCFIHAFSRRGGIWLNNILAMIKVGILLLIIALAIAVAAGLKNTKNVFKENADPSNAFSDASHDPNGYSDAFLAIIFTISGFEQPTYVMAEIGNPRRRFPIGMIISVSTVLVLYMAVNVSYMVVVPADLQRTGDGGVAQQFFELTLGRISSNASKLGPRILNAFLAISSLGNITVMTYTAARVKQEIAKEGILPFARFFAQNRDISLGRLLKWFNKRGFRGWPFNIRWFSPEHHSEETPVGAFVLHFLACLILIFSTWKLTPSATYTLLSNVSAYMVNCFFGVFLAVGILVLRFRGPPATAEQDTAISDSQGVSGSIPPWPQKKTWTEMTRGTINPVLSVICAIVYLLGSLFPLAASWLKPQSSNNTDAGFEWYLIPTLAWAVIGAGIAWFLGFIVWSKTSKHKHEVFVVEKKPEFEPDNDEIRRRKTSSGESGNAEHGSLVLVHETVFLSWVGRENLTRRGFGSAADISETRESVGLQQMDRNRQSPMGVGVMQSSGYQPGHYQ